jgi:hypothetical protein
MKIKNLKVNQKKFNELKDGFFALVSENGEKVLVGASVLSIAAIIGISIGVGVNTTKNYDTNKAVLDSYYEQVDNIDNDDFDEDKDDFSKLVAYINLSEELHDLKLYSSLAGNGEITSFDYDVELESIDQVETKITEFKELKNKVNHSIEKANDDVIAYNKVVYELRLLEEQVNKKVKHGYSVIENYGKWNAKSLLASKYDVSVDDAYVYLSDSGEVNSIVAGKSTSEFDRYLDELNKVNQMDDGKSKIKEGGYNHDRNKLLKDAVIILTERSAKYIQKNNLIEDKPKSK